VHSLSAVIITRNEAARLERCVEACRAFADEVVVVDSGSDDGTVELARSLGCSVHENPWPGFGRQRNVAAGLARHDWILWVDADEVVGAGLAEALRGWKRTAAAEPVAFRVERIGDFMGRWLERASQRHLRLYDRRLCRVTDVPVHEEVDPGGARVGDLPGVLWHHGFRSISDHVERFDRYTTLEAQKAHAAGRSFSAWRLLWRPPARLLQRLVLQRLYRKGVAGLAVCALWVHYELMRELKLRELEWRAAGAPEEREADVR
jgi:glycosyltransferase involved in cell wall biosynthesis